MTAIMKLPEDDIAGLSQMRSEGAAVKETSYYGVLAELLDEVCKTLKAKARYVINL